MSDITFFEFLFVFFGAIVAWLIAIPRHPSRTRVIKILAIVIPIALLVADKTIWLWTERDITENIACSISPTAPSCMKKPSETARDTVVTPVPQPTSSAQSEPIGLGTVSEKTDAPDRSTIAAEPRQNPAQTEQSPSPVRQSEPTRSVATSRPKVARRPSNRPAQEKPPKGPIIELELRD